MEDQVVGQAHPDHDQGHLPESAMDVQGRHQEIGGILALGPGRHTVVTQGQVMVDLVLDQKAQFVHLMLEVVHNTTSMQSLKSELSCQEI